MSKIRINDLARELEVKSKSILDVLPEIGVTEKKSHSSSLEDHEAEKVRARLRASSAAQTSSRSSRPARADADEIKTKIDLSHISKPGDALKAIISKQQPSSAAEAPARSTAARKARGLGRAASGGDSRPQGPRSAACCSAQIGGADCDTAAKLYRSSAALHLNRQRPRLQPRPDRQFHRRRRRFQPAARRRRQRRRRPAAAIRHNRRPWLPGQPPRARLCPRQRRRRE